jgi:hypothetical protein
MMSPAGCSTGSMVGNSENSMRTFFTSESASSAGLLSQVSARAAPPTELALLLARHRHEGSQATWDVVGLRSSAHSPVRSAESKVVVQYTRSVLGACIRSLNDTRRQSIRVRSRFSLNPTGQDAQR